MLSEKLEELLLDVQKPSRYIGGELGSVIKDKSKIDVRFAFCFPDSYEIGMSHLGIKILYSLINSRENYWCERVFAPWPDFNQKMRENDIPLYGLESLEPIYDADFIGFTLQYELCYTNILEMLDLARVPIFQKDRGEQLFPLVIAGGPCACNPEPLADFFDLFILGDGEEVNLELLDLYAEMKKQGATRSEFLKAAAQIEGIYVPSLYTPVYHEDGTFKEMLVAEGAPSVVKKRIVTDMRNCFYPDQFVVPFSECVHDRSAVEVLRGCIRGCRFCQAGFLYRPYREKPADTVISQAKKLCKNTGYEELSLLSLSTSDHTEIEKMLDGLLDYTEDAHINLALPSMRIDSFSPELLDKIKRVRKSGLTFAPEAGTQRMRDVINKNITEEEVMYTCRTAFEGGYMSVKLYFMMGLPTETDEDLLGIIELAQKVVDLYYTVPQRPKGKGVQVSISVATFVPKPFTPFQFCAQATPEEIQHKQEVLREAVKPHRKIKISMHYSETSLLEAVLARGDRKLCAVLYDAWKNGCTYDAWDEFFDWEKWNSAFEKNHIKPEFYASRERATEEAFPWDHLDYLLTKKFLVREYNTAMNNQTTPNCRQKCAGCGIKCGEGGCTIWAK